MVLSGVGTILLVFPLTMVLPFIVGLLFKEDIMFLVRCFILPALATFTVGFAFTKSFGRADRPTDEMRPSESLIVVAFVWLVASLFGDLPYVLSGAIPNIIDAYFETMSGFTTTGASVISDVDAVQRSVLFWRALTQWLGGMGIIVLVVAFFSRYLGGYKAGLLMLKGEVPGHSTEKVVHRLKDTGKYLFFTYGIMTLFGTVILSLLGMTVFDAICHTFTALATGGFGNHTESIYYYRNLPTYIPLQLALGLLMVLGSTSFVLHYNLIFKRDWKIYLKSPELRVYLSILLIVICIVTLDLALNRYYGPWESLLNSFFTIVTMNSTTGYATEDFGKWSSLSQFLIILVMLFGGMTGSTCGGLKTARLMVVNKAVTRSLIRIGHPRAIKPIRIGGVLIPEKVIKMIGMFVFGYILTFILGTFLLTLTGLDFMSSISASAATLGGVGPGLNVVGPWSNYSSLSIAAKLILTTLMWLGRLELITGFVIFLPSTYRK